MKIIKLLILLIIFVGTFCTSCEKDDNNPDSDPEPLVFTCITADSDSILINTTTKVTAFATGYKLTYTWWATKGEIIGSGSSVNYAAPPCTPGSNTVSCTIKDGYNNYLTESVDIVVHI